MIDIYKQKRSVDTKEKGISNLYIYYLLGGREYGS